MAITIKELLAADTISQAADKINFNFDQLLLNGGGPVGPIGPLGPPGPIGGRGIRGSIWYEGEDNPNSIIFPSLETGDQYLRGPISSGETGDGDVFEYTGSNWVYTGINLKGDTGDSGTSEWTFYQNGLDADFIYPSINTLFHNDVKAAVIGAVPSTVPAPSDTNFVLDNGIANNLNTDFASLLIHVPDSSIESIVFSGGDAALDYTTDWTQLTRIGLKDGDRLQIQDARNVGGLNDVGINFISEYRNIEFDVCRTFQVQTGLIGSGAGLTQPADIYLRVTTTTPTGASAPGVIRLHNQGGNNADFKIGAPIGTTGFAGSPTGNIWGEGHIIDFNAENQIKLNSPSGWINAIYLDATAGGITIDSATETEMNNNIFDVNSTTSITLTSGDVMTYTSTNDATFQSSAGKVLINAPAAWTTGAIELDTGGKIILTATHNIELTSAEAIEIQADEFLYLWGDKGITVATNDSAGFLLTQIDSNIQFEAGISTQSIFEVDSQYGEIILKTTDIGVQYGANNNSIFLQAQRQDLVPGKNGIGIQMLETRRPGSALSVGGDWGDGNVSIGDGIATNVNNPDNSLWVEAYLGIGTNPTQNWADAHILNPQAVIYKDSTGLNIGTCALSVRNDNIDTSGPSSMWTPEISIGINTKIEGSNGQAYGQMYGHRTTLKNGYLGPTVAGNNTDFGHYINFEWTGNTNRKTYGFAVNDNSRGLESVGFNYNGYSSGFPSGTPIRYGFKSSNEDYNYFGTSSGGHGGFNIGVGPSHLYEDPETPQFAFVVTADKREYNMAGASGNPGPAYMPDWPCLAHFHNASGSDNSGNILLSSGAGIPDMSKWAYMLFANVNGSGTLREENGSITGGTGNTVMYNTSSDARLKTKIVDFEDGLDIVMELKPRKFEWKRAPGVECIGLIAQEVHKIAPQYVKGRIDDERSQLGMDYGKLTPLLIGAVQKQQQMIEEKDERIKSLEDRLKLIEEKLGL